MTVTIVAGPPLAGKTSYVKAHAKEGALVYDFDALHSTLSGLPLYEHKESIKGYVIAARDGIYAELERRVAENIADDAWIITATKHNEVVQELASRFNGEVIVLMITREEAHLRCDAEERPAEWHKYIDAWFDENDFSEVDFNQQTTEVIDGQAMTVGAIISHAHRKRLLEIQSLHLI